MKCSLGISNFLEEISSLSHSVVFLYCFALIAEEGFLISLLFFGTLHSDVYIFPFLLCFLLLFFSELFVRPPQTANLLFCILAKFVLGSWFSLQNMLTWDNVSLNFSIFCSLSRLILFQITKSLFLLLNSYSLNLCTVSRNLKAGCALNS